eukprot:534568-Rhodomonas_salina.4
MRGTDLGRGGTDMGHRLCGSHACPDAGHAVVLTRVTRARYYQDAKQYEKRPIERATASVS